MYSTPPPPLAMGPRRDPMTSASTSGFGRRGDSPPRPALHLAALAFVPDSHFLAAVPHSHGVWRFAQAPVSEFYVSPKDSNTA